MIVLIKTPLATPEQPRYLTACKANGFPVVLLEDGVYQASILTRSRYKVWLKQSDAEQRGILCDQAEMLSEAQLVTLTEKYGKQVIIR